MQEIILSKGEIALIDDEDFDYINSFKWYASNGYAINEKRQKMHRLILKPLPTELVDHKDHNKLNNQKSNIRIANRHENIHNQHKRTNTNNNYKGTNFVKHLGLWQSRCRMYKKDFYLGLYKSEIAAAYAYNKKAIELSDFALLNEINLPKEYLEKILISDRALPSCAEKRSGIKGVSWNKSKNKWEVTFRKKYLGAYNNLETAIEIMNTYLWQIRTHQTG